jgi:hypothetical protein
MSGLAFGRGKVVGLTAAAAVLLSATSAGASVAAATPESPKLTALKHSRTLETARSVHSAGSADALERAAAVAADPEEIPSVCTSIASISPTKVVLGATPVKVKFSVKVNGCTLDAWAVFANYFTSTDPYNTSGIAGNLFYYDENGDVQQFSPTVALSPKVLTNAVAGKQTDGASVWAWGEEDPADTDTVVVAPVEALLPFTAQRRSTFGSTFNATPEPVKKGKAITLKGTLARINWNGAKTLKYVGFPKAKIQVQFKATTATKYTTIKTVTAAAGGKVTTKVAATKSGRYRFVFAGISTTAPATSASDLIKVTS